MKVIAKVKKGGRDLVNLLEKEMIQAKLMRTGVLVPLSSTKEGAYRIPLLIRDKKPYIFLQLEESGGSNGQSGFAQIICDANGERLKPFCVRRNIGRFNVTNKATVICASSSYGGVHSLTIETHRIFQRDNSSVVIKKNQLWGGRNSRLPEHLSRFERAVKAAIRKSRCSDCKHLHFAT